MRRTVSVLVLAVAVASLTAGCRFSKVGSQATVHISGRALTSSGAPLAGAQVRLFKEADLGEALTGIVLAVGSLGTVCLLPGAPAICRQARVATTDADGRYTFTLTGADTQGTLGTESTLDVVVAAPGVAAGRASTTLSFPVRSATVRLPAARLWDARLHTAETAARIVLRWSPLQPAAGRSAEYFAQLYDPARAAPVWSQPAGRHTGAIDARVIEDHAAGAAVTARTSLAGASGTGDVHAAYVSAQRPVRPLAGPPPSRGRPCFAVSGTAGFVTTAQHPCAATDGDLLTPAHLTATKTGVVTGVVVDLGRPRRIHLVLARGLSGSYLVEVSLDGRNYRAGSLESGSPVAVHPSGAPLARYVRIRAPSGLDESLVTEVSVW